MLERVQELDDKINQLEVFLQDMLEWQKEINKTVGLLSISQTHKLVDWRLIESQLMLQQYDETPGNDDVAKVLIA